MSTPIYVPNEMSKALLDELETVVRGQVCPRDNQDFVEYTKMFNGNVKTAAQVVVCPLDAVDVSNIVKFCIKNSLSHSVKAGGFGTAGWAIAGDVVIDLSKLVDIDIEPPQPGHSFTRLRDMPSAGNKGKGKALASTNTSSGKRRREDDAELRSYDSASRAVASFLRGPPLPADNRDNPPPSIRRRIDPDPELRSSREVSQESDSSKDSSTSSRGFSSSRTGSSSSTVYTTPSPPSMPLAYSAPPFSNNADPFGYLSNGLRDFPPPPPPNTMQSAFTPYSMYNSWAPGASAAYGRHSSAAVTIVQPIEPLHEHAYVTFGAGMRQKEIDIYTAEHPLRARPSAGSCSVIPYHVPFAAHPVGSSIMLLGGFGFLGRLHGLSIDNLVEVEMVLADGTIVFVSEKEHPDLWWALRGAGPAFGIATRYKARAYPVPVVYAGNLIYRFNRTTAPSLIKHFRDCVKGAPRELYANVLLTAGPAGKDSLIVVQICYNGPKDKGQEYLAAISSWDGERCLLNEVDEKSFLHQQDSVAQVLRGKAGRQWFIRSTLITSLPDDIINDTVMQFADTPVGCTWLFELAGGRIAECEGTCVPRSQREAAFTIAALHQWEMGVNDPRCMTSAEDWMANTLSPVATGGPYPSFLGRHEPPKRTIACFGENWDRLRELKTKYDPKCIFHNNFWPLDVDGKEIDPIVHEPESP